MSKRLIQSVRGNGCRAGRRIHVLAGAAVIAIGRCVAGDTWDGGANNGGAWSTNINWADNTEPTSADAAIFPTPIPNGDATIVLSSGELANNLVFHDSYTLTGGNLTLGGGQIQVDPNKTATITSSINGSGGLTMQGSSGVGTLVLNPTGSNGFIGPVEISFATLSINKDSALGNAANTVLLGAAFSTLEVTGNFSTSRVITPGTQGGIITVDSGRFLTLNAGLGANANSFTFNGAGSLNVNAASSRTGTTTIQNGTVTLINNGGLGSGAVTVGSAAMLDMAGGTVSNPLSLQNTGTIRGNSNVTYTGTITAQSFAPNLTLATAASSDVLKLSSYTGGNGSTTHVTGSGTVSLGNANTYSGAWAVDSGTLAVGHSDALGSGTSPVVVNNSGTLQVFNVTFARDVTLNNGATLAFQNGGQSFGTHTIASGAAVTFACKSGGGSFLGNAANDLTGGSGATITVTSDTAGNSLALVQASDYAGNWTVNPFATLRVAGPAALGSGTSAVFLANNATPNGGTLEVVGIALGRNVTMLNGATVRGTGTASVTGTINFNAFGTANFAAVAANNTLTIGDAANDYTGTATSTVISGLGTVSFPFANTNTGAWQIDSGTLRIGDSASMGTGTSAVVINNNARLDINNVTLDRAITLNSGGTAAGIGANARSNGTMTIPGTADVFLGTGTSLTDVFMLGNGANDLTGGAAGSSITVNGLGKVVLTQDSNYTGDWITSTGTLEISANAQLGTLTNAVQLGPGGGLSTTATFTSARIFTPTGGSISVAPSTTLTLSTALPAGPGALTKMGDGTLQLNAASTRTGATVINFGMVRLTSGAGLGTGNATVNSGTLEIANTSVSNGGITLNNGGTLRATGTSLYTQSGFPAINNVGNMNMTVAEATDTLSIGSAIRNVSAAASSATIHVNGAGRLLLQTGETAGSDIFGGSWEQSAGILQIGQTTGSAINALGFKNGDPKQANTIAVNGGTLAVGVLGSGTATPPWLRANVMLQGGAIASTNGVNAQYGGDFIVVAGATSKVLLFDPVSTSTARSVSLVAGAAGTDNNPSATIWDPNSTLIVDPGTTTGGQFIISRTGGIISVGFNAALQINSGAAVNFLAAADALSDGTHHVNVLNNGTFLVQNFSKNVGNIDGAGNTDVIFAGGLTATHIRQNALNVGGDARVTIRANGGNTGISYLNSLTLSGTLDLNDNDLVVNSGVYTTIRASVLAGFGNPAGPGITSSTSTGSTRLALFDNAMLGTPLTSWNGQTIAATAIVGKYTYFGDVNIDGQVTGDDYTVVDSNLNTTPPVGLEWLRGDANTNGDVTGDDYTVIDANLGSGVGNPLSASELGDRLTPGTLSVVPEPTLPGVIALVGATISIRRRRCSIADDARK